MSILDLGLHDTRRSNTTTDCTEPTMLSYVDYGTGQISCQLGFNVLVARTNNLSNYLNIWETELINSGTVFDENMTCIRYVWLMDHFWLVIAHTLWLIHCNDNTIAFTRHNRCVTRNHKHFVTTLVNLGESTPRLEGFATRQDNNLLLNWNEID